MKYNFEDDDYYVQKNNKKYTNDNKKKFKPPIALIFFVIIFAYFMFFGLFPEPSAKTIAEVRKINKLNESYENDVSKLNYLYESVIKKDTSNKKIYEQEIHTINANSIQKTNITKKLIDLVVVEKSRLSNNEINQLIKEYYTIDDSKLIVKITKFYTLLNMLYENTYPISEVKLIYYDESKLFYSRLFSFYENEKKTKKIQEKQQTIERMLKTLENDFKKFKLFSGNKNYIKIAQKIINIKNIWLKFQELTDVKYKYLKDMDIKFFLQLGKTSWNYSSDSEYNYTYPMKELTRKQYELALSNINQYAAINVIKTDGEYSGMTNRTFWINEQREVFYHQYTNVINKKESISKWTEVDEKYFFANKNNIKKAIYYKKFGDLDSEATAPLTKHESENIQYSHRNSYWGGTYFFYHSAYSSKDNYRYNNRRKNLRNRGSSNIGRGPSGGGK